MSPLPRELVRWIQTLDLPIPVKLPKRDLSNGYLFAEMCARYWNGVELHCFENKLSKANKEANWKVLRKYFAKNKFLVDEILIQEVIRCEEGAAEQFLYALYTALTKREIQVFPPSHEPEVDQVPVFVKQTQQHQSVERQNNKAGGSNEQQEEQRQAEERARAEAQRRAEAQQRQQQPNKPKTLAKAQAIQAAEKEDQDGQVQHAVQFSSVTVKPLPPHMLARFGNSRAGGGGGDGTGRGGGKGGANSGGSSDNEGVVGFVSSILSKTLEDSNLPSWPTSASIPTPADYFFRNLHQLDANLCKIQLSQLMSHIEEVGTMLARRPSEFSALVELLEPCLVPKGNNNNNNNSTSPTQAAAARYFSAVTAIASSTNPASVLHGLREAFLPLVLRCCPLTASTASWFADMLLSFVHVVNGSTPVFSSMFFSSIYDGLCALPSGMRHRSDFLLILYAVLPGFASRKKSIALDPSHHAPPLQLDAQCAGVAYYNAVAGMHSEAPRDRIAGMKLLVRLVELGAGAMVLENHHLADAVEAVALRKPAWTWTTDGLLVFTQLVDAVLDLKEGHDVLPESTLTVLRSGLQCMQLLALDDRQVLPHVVRQAMLLCVAKGLVLFAAEAEPSPLATGLASYLLRPTFATKHAALLGVEPAASPPPQGDDVVGGGAAAPLREAQPVLHDSLMLGKIRATPILRVACPLRLSLAIVHVTVEASVGAAGGAAGGKDEKKGNAASSTAKAASRILKLGDTKELATTRLQWLHELFRAHEDGTLAAGTKGHVHQEDLVTLWWGFVKQIEGCMTVALYTAELLASQQQSAATNAKVAAQLPSEAITAEVFGTAALAQSVLVRCFIDFSGHVQLPTSAAEYAELRQDPGLAARASEWFNQIVVGSS